MRLHTFLVIGLALLLPSLAHAYQIGTESSGILCAFLPCSAGGGGAAGLSAYALEKIVFGMEVAIVAVAIIALFISASQMVIFGQDEAQVKDARMSYVYIIVGLAVVGLARWLVMAFSPSNNGAELVNVTMYEQGIANIITYFRLVIAISLSVNIVVQAFRMLASQGEQEQTDKAKKRLIGGFVGAGMVMMANALVVAMAPSLSGAQGVSLEIVGLANYLVTIVGFLALVVIAGAGVLLIVSADEGLKEKAKMMVKTAVVVLIFVVLAYALVTAFIAI